MSVKEIENDIQRYGNTVLRTASSIIKDSNDVQDIFQEVFIKLYERKENFDTDEHKKAWLIRVTVNQCKSLLRRSWYKNRNELDENMQTQEKEENGVLDTVNQLPEKYRIVIYLFYYEKYRESEIAEILHTSEGTIKSRLFRARNLLKEKLKGGFENE